VYWRKRLAKSDRPHRINEVVRQVVEETGVLRGRRKRAVDSTILADAVATQDTITQLIGAIRRVGRLVPGADAVIAAVCTAHDYTKPGKPVIDWDEPGAKDALVGPRGVRRRRSGQGGGVGAGGVGVAGPGRRPRRRARRRI